MTKPNHPATYEAEHSFPLDQPRVSDQVPLAASLTETYRCFRRLYTPKTPRTKHRSDCIIDGYDRMGSRDSLGLAQARTDIRSFREEIVRLALRDSSFCKTNKSHLAKALRVSENIVSPPTWLAILVKMIGSFLPTAVQASLLKGVFKNARTYESRKFLFHKYVVFSYSDVDYSDSLDYALMKIPATNESFSFRDFRSINIHWLRVVHRLGSKNWSDVRLALQGHEKFRPAQFEELLVEQGVIRSLPELSWLLPPARDLPFNPSHKKIKWCDATELMKQLVESGLSRELIAKALVTTSSDFVAIQLAEKFDLLKQFSIDQDGVFSHLGSLFWKMPYERLRFLINELGFASAEQLGAAIEFLSANREMDREFFLRYRQFGAAPENFIEAKKLLTSVNREESSSHCVTALELLMGTPYSLPLNSLAQCENYILSKGSLATYLELLARHGLTTPDDILCFQGAYSPFNLRTVEQLFDLALPRCEGSDKSRLNRWIVDATRSGYLEIFEYLIIKLNAQSLSELESILKFANVNLTILKYVVEERGVSTLKRLTQWYYRNAVGIHRVSLPAKFGITDRILLESAFVTNRFSPLPKNRAIIEAEIDRRVVPKITSSMSLQGHRSQDYFVEKAQLENIESARIAPYLPDILKATAGVLLPSIVKGVGSSDWSLSDRIAEFEPVAKELLSGRGPVQPELTPLEEEALGLVYGIPVDRVRPYWHDLTTGNVTEKFTASDHVFPMEWKRKELSLTRSLDKRGFNALGEAVRFAQRFKQFCRTDIRAACIRLSPKRLSADERDTSTLSSHLGLLLAIGGMVDETSRHTDVLKDIADIENHASSHDRVAQLSNIFSIELRDAVIERMDGFLVSLPYQNREFLASRIAIDHQSFGDNINERLRKLFAYTLDTVTEKYLGWAERERKKFRPEVLEQSTSKTYGVISKYPASFFAPLALGICTGGDLALWGDDRLSLFLIFDEKEKRLAGMAYVFKHILATDCGEKPILVARAFNVMPEYLAGFDAISMVQSIIHALTEYTKLNGFSALAVPDDTGQHILSNSVELEKAIKARLGKATTCYGPISLKESADLLRPVCVKSNFDAYSEGREIVDHLYIVWRDRVNAVSPDIEPD